MSKRAESPRILACRGDEELLIERTPEGGFSFLSDLEIYGKFSASTPPSTRELKAGGGQDTNAHRLEMIQAVRSGTHLEIVVKRALAYRQPKGKPNRRHLRFSDDQLESGAPSWKGQPFLVDHNTYEQDARKGTILTSSFDQDLKGAPAYFMGFSVVKPDAAISVLDGTIDRFSIGWFSTGAVICTAHGVDIRGKDACYCWPGEKVLVDGKEKIVEYEYQSFAGKELSAVNVPAVIGTKIEEYHSALTAELDLPPTRNIPKERKTMSFSKLAAALALTALAEADEDRAVSAVTALRARAESAEIDAATLRKENTRLSTELAVQTAIAASAAKLALDGMISDAYKTGRLAYGKDAAGANTPDPLEDLLRAHGATAGREALAAKIGSMKVVVPVGVRQLTPDIKDPARQDGALTPSEADIVSAAAQLGVSVDEVRARLVAGGAQ